MSFNGWKQWLLVGAGVMLATSQNLIAEESTRVAEEQQLMAAESQQPLSPNTLTPSEQQQSSVKQEPEAKDVQEKETEELINETEEASGNTVEEQGQSEMFPAPADVEPSSDSAIRIPKSDLPVLPDLDSSVPIPQLLDLPDDLREQIGAIPVFTGHVYSTTKGKSSVVIEPSKIYKEGEEISSQLMLEKVTEKGVILNWNQGTRFQIDVLGSQYFK